MPNSPICNDLKNFPTTPISPKWLKKSTKDTTKRAIIRISEFKNSSCSLFSVFLLTLFVLLLFFVFLVVCFRLATSILHFHKVYPRVYLIWILFAISLKYSDISFTLQQQYLYPYLQAFLYAFYLPRLQGLFSEIRYLL